MFYAKKLREQACRFFWSFENPEDTCNETEMMLTDDEITFYINKTRSAFESDDVQKNGGWNIDIKLTAVTDR